MGMPHQGETSSGNQDALPWCGEEQEQAGLVKGGNRELGKKVKRSAVLSRDTHPCFSDFASSEGKEIRQIKCLWQMLVTLPHVLLKGARQCGAGGGAENSRHPKKN